MSEHPTTPNAAELIARIQDRLGISRADIAAQLGRSPRMVSKIATGQTSGASYVPALSQLDATGTVRDQPPRRRGRDGRVVPVRVPVSDRHQPRQGPGGRTVAPVATPPGSTTRDVPRQFATSTHHGPGGITYHDVQMKPGSRTSAKRAREAFAGALNTVIKGQRSSYKRVSFTVTLDNGQKVQLGSKSGYYGTELVRAARKDFGGDLFAFISHQLNNSRTYEGVMDGRSIARIETSVQNAKRAPQHSAAWERARRPREA